MFVRPVGRICLEVKVLRPPGKKGCPRRLGERIGSAAAEAVVDKRQPVASVLTGQGERGRVRGSMVWDNQV